MIVGGIVTGEVETVREALRRFTKRVASAPLERELKRDLRSAFLQQGELIVKAIGRSRIIFPEHVILEAIPEQFGPLFDQVEIQSVEAFARPIDRATRAGLRAGLKKNLGVGEIKIALDVNNPRAVAYLNGRAAARVAGVNAATRRQLEEILVKAAEEGWSYDRTSRAIKRRYSQFARGVPQKHIRSRAELIAVTEVGEAYEAGSLMQGEELASMGLPIEKSWLTAGDARVCVNCRTNAQQGWIVLNQPFQSGHMRPLAHPACRSTLQQRLAES